MLLKGLDENYQSYVWRTLREKIADVTPDSLPHALHLFPELLADLVLRGDRTMAVEMDNIVRYALCPALEGRNRGVLEISVKMGFMRLCQRKRACGRGLVGYGV